MKLFWTMLAMLSAVTVAAAAEAPSKPAGINFDSNKPIQVNADTFLADLNAQTGTYRGNVVVVQGQIKLHANEVKVFAPDGKAQRMEAHGGVVVDTPNGTATGDHGMYDVVGRVIHLTGNVVLSKDRNVMRGNALDVQIATGEARLTAAGTAPGQTGRVQAVIVPNQTPRPPKPAPQAAPAAPPSNQ